MLILPKVLKSISGWGYQLIAQRGVDGTVMHSNMERLSRTCAIEKVQLAEATIMRGCGNP